MRKFVWFIKELLMKGIRKYLWFINALGFLLCCNFFTTLALYLTTTGLSAAQRRQTLATAFEDFFSAKKDKFM
jgi:hypothetical protein